MRWFKSLTFHWQAFIKTAMLSAFLVVVPYNFAYMIKYYHAKAEILARQDPTFTTDNLKV
jgi:hypothetical protein